ncbi:HTH domain-containing protein [Candidatus Woesearchaeota archaeon]|nr:HTH domain-containing protein [Candidatus Woesearchaeota archaeon]
MFNSDNEKKIVEFVKKSPFGVSSSEIAKYIGLNRMTITKYLAIIKEKALIDFKQFGMAKLWFIPVDISKESFFEKIMASYSDNISLEELKHASENAGIDLGEEINLMYLQFYDTEKLSFDQLCDCFVDVGKKLNGSFKASGKFNEKIDVEILKSPFSGGSVKAMNTVLSGVFAKIASLNLGYARALVKEEENKNSIIEVFLKQEEKQ